MLPAPTLPPASGQKIDLDEKYALLVDMFAPAPAMHIFNTPEFFRLHAVSDAHYFQLCERKSGAVLASTHFTATTPGCYRSPARGTFGGISATTDFSVEQIEIFASAFEDILRAGNAKRLQIVMPPASHDSALFAKCFNVLSRRGFSVAAQELNYDIDVSDAPLADRMDYGNRKRLNKCLREGFATTRLGPEHHEAAYRLIAENRRRKGHPITMDFPAVMTMVDTFGDRLRFFGVTRGEQLVAASICIVVSEQVMSVFYWGDSEGVQDYSPVVLLAADIYAHCQQAGIHLLDTGIATEAGTPNYGLMRFKRSLGFRESLKLVLAKDCPANARP